VAHPLVLVCESGRRAAQAAAILKDKGFQDLTLLDGGMGAWSRAGLPIVEGRKRLSLERQVRIIAGSIAASGGFLALLVDPLFALLPAIIGSGLAFAGVTDICGMAILLGKLPYNRESTFDCEEMICTLRAGSPSPSAQRS
jgi:hypothetical protein